MKFIKIFTLTLISTLLISCSDYIKKLEIKNPAAPAKYYEGNHASMPIEQKYTKLGEYAVASKVFSSDVNKYKEYKVWYPKRIVDSNNRYPVVVFANGSGVKYYRYESVFEHLASWRFVVIGNDDPTSFSGESSSKALALLDKLNTDKGSIFYGKLDTHNAGISGHSQGGVGAITAATNYPNSSQYKAVFTASTLRHAAATAIKWPYDISKINVPYFAVAGTGSMDAGSPTNPEAGIAPLSSVIENHEKLKNNQLTMMAIRKKNDHPEMLYIGDGYMTAFFRFILMSDVEAGKAFIGAQPEILKNSNWQDVKIKNKP
ncbi:chlorophyllase/cutinase-like alpha/beta fold protein [Mesoflavibacter zeaxanthinifaciens]|uniref:poly(ethylene terephthalate) hydrolase family protein n=1 Tax=Mesoflavibacter zeaxanthinifaciens TaxID=393060 RepID=UPI003A95CA1D